jgi:adenosine deaminase
MLKVVHETVAPGTTFRPELGIIRSRPVGELQPLIEAFLCLDYFRSIDLYDDEFSRPVSSFRSIYRMAKSLGLKCKAHAGEFGNADSVKEAAEELELDAIQHGIAAASSPAVMYWLADNHITLNVCPTSNIKLKRCRSYKTHPVRILYDHGVRVTINSDDILVFGSEVSSEYLRLFRSGLFNSKELDQIRLNGLNENA